MTELELREKDTAPSAPTEQPSASTRRRGVIIAACCLAAALLSAGLIWRLAAPASTVAHPPVAPESITIHGREISTDVTELDLTGWGLTDEDIVELSKCTRLTDLNLSSGSNEDGDFVNNRFTDLSPLASLTGLAQLDLGNSVTEFPPQLGRDYIVIWRDED